MKFDLGLSIFSQGHLKVKPKIRFKSAQCIEYKCALLTRKAVNGQAPTYLRDLTSFREDRSHLSKNVKLLKVPKTELEEIDLMLYQICTMYMNSLPSALKDTEDISFFK